MVIPRVTRHGYGFFAGLNSHTRTRTHGKTHAKPTGIPLPMQNTNRDPHTRRLIRYIQLDAQVRNINDYSVPWIVTDTILQPGEPSPEIGIGSHIEMTDSQRFEVDGFARRQKGRLERICGYEQGYVQFVLRNHAVGAEDIYGSHLPKLTVAIPIHFLRLSPIQQVYYNLAFSLRGRTMGQTVDDDMVLPPRRSFVLFGKTEYREVEVARRFVEVNAEQRLREADRIEGIIECIERENNWVE
jgi:hypothetical protein